MSEMKLTEEQERDIWENAPEGYNWCAYSNCYGWDLFTHKPEYYEDQCNRCPRWEGGGDAIGLDGVPFEAEADERSCVFERPERYRKKPIPSCALLKTQFMEYKAPNTYKPDYYLRAGEQYQPNRISDAYNLEGSKNQALKYLLRAGHKPIDGKSKTECEIIDLNKAKQQIIDRIDFLEGLE